MQHGFCSRRTQTTHGARLECGDWSPLSRVDRWPHRAACRPKSSGRLGAERPHSVSWNSRQQAAWSCQYADLQSGDQSPHSKRPVAPCSELVVGQKLCGIRRNARAPFAVRRHSNLQCARPSPSSAAPGCAKNRMKKDNFFPVSCV